MLKRWLLSMLILAAVAAPATSQAHPPLVKFAHGTASMKDFYGRGPNLQFALVGSFRIGKNTYKGAVTGDWGYDGLGGPFSSQFSGSDGGHTFAATCDFGTPVAESLTSLVVGTPPTISPLISPTPASQTLFCHASIDGSAPTGLILDFVWLTFAPGSCGSFCYYNEYTGYFVGV